MARQRDDVFLETEDDPIEEALNPVDRPEEVNQAEDAARKIIQARMYAYRRIFEGAGSADDVKIFMSDLERFCRGDTTPWHIDARVHALFTGRFEVFRRIEDFRTLSLDALIDKYHNGKRPSET